MRVPKKFKSLYTSATSFNRGANQDPAETGQPDLYKELGSPESNHATGATGLSGARAERPTDNSTSEKDHISTNVKPTSPSNTPRDMENASPTTHSNQGSNPTGREHTTSTKLPPSDRKSVPEGELGLTSPAILSSESRQPGVVEGEHVPLNGEAILDGKHASDDGPGTSSDVPQETAGTPLVSPSYEDSQPGASKFQHPTSNGASTSSSRDIEGNLSNEDSQPDASNVQHPASNGASALSSQDTEEPPTALSDEDSLPVVGGGVHVASHPSNVDKPLPSPPPAQGQLLISKDERIKQQNLKEKTAFVAGGKKGFLDKIPWTKRQETGNSDNSDSIQKRLIRFASTAKAVPLDMDDLSDDQVIIAVMGPTGAGKSSFIAAVTGGDVVIGHDLQSCTTEIKIVKYECPDKSDFDVVFVDTPGFDDTQRTDVEILEMIADWLNKTYERKIILAGILYFHRISDNRMAGTPLKNLRMFRELCGKNALQNIILTTTMWDEVDPKVGEGREGELRSKYWKAMIDQGSATARFHSTQESAWDIVDHFVRDANARHAVLLQKEMSEMKKQLPETNAGQKLYTELEVLVHKQQATLKKIREETKLHADAVILDALKAEYNGLRTQLATVVNDMERMKLPLGKRILRLIWGPMFGQK